MLHIPILRNGTPYESVETVELAHYATGEPVALVSQANSGLVSRDIHRMDRDILEQFTCAELIAMSRKAGDIFMNGTVPCGNESQSFDDYIRNLSDTTGMPVSYCRNNAKKIFRIFDEIERVIAGLTRGFDLSILDQGYGDDEGRTLSFYREANSLGAVLPSNSPGVHALWIPAIAMKCPLVLKPGREEPWSPLRIIESFKAAGVPAEAFGFYPTDHAGAGEILRNCGRSMLFGGDATTKPYANDSRVELHGPGYTKIAFGDDMADDWEKHVDLMVQSVAANGGRSCINCSSIWTPRHGRAIADALARELAKVEALPANDPNAQIAAFANPAMAEMMSESIDAQLGNGAEDLTQQYRGSGRLIRKDRIAWVLPTILWCEDREHALASKEFLFPYTGVVECPVAEMPKAFGPTLVTTAITNDKKFIAALMAEPNIDRLNIGPMPTFQLSWDQPHEGNLFEHLYRQRAFQLQHA